MITAVKFKETEVLSEVNWDGKTVWVNGSDGVCLGRFSKFGIDIHKDFEGQTNGGQCLDCKAGPLDQSDWVRFRDGMKAYHDIDVPEESRPKFLAWG